MTDKIRKMTDEIIKMIFISHFNNCLENKKRAQSATTYHYYTGAASELVSFAYVAGIINKEEFLKMYDKIYPELF